MDEIEAIESGGGMARGVPTGFVNLDEVTNGLHPGQMIIVAARPGVGKALALDVPLPTPTGWTTMGDVAVGDELLGPDGRPTRVVAATEVMCGRPCYEVEFSDGATIVADEQHQWLTHTKVAQESGVGARNHPTSESTGIRTTAEIAATLHSGPKDQPSKHCVTNTAPLDLVDRQYPVLPYTLGAWLGGGSAVSGQINAADPEISMRLEADAQTSPHRPLESRLRALGVLGDKHIPHDYLRGSESQRRDLLSGLLDTAATVSECGDIEASFPSHQLATDVAELVVSLGYRCRRPVMAPEDGHEVSRQDCTLVFSADDRVFGSERKAMTHKERHANFGTAETSSRSIVTVRRVDSVPVRCVQVDNDSHLYLASRSMIPTHNSTLALDFLRSCSIKNRMAGVIFSLEMSKSEIVMRLLSAEAKIKLADMRSGRMSHDDWSRLARRMSEISEAPMFIDDSPNLTMMEVRAKARRLRQKADLRLVVIDYLQLMSSGKKFESRQQEVSEFSRSLKLLAKELEVPVVALSQLNRGPEQRNDKKPMLADLRESGSIEQDSDVVVLMHRPDLFEQEGDERAGEADLIIAKHRNGPTRTVTVAHQLHYSRFANMAR